MIKLELVPLGRGGVGQVRDRLDRFGTSWTSGDKLDKFETAVQVVRISFPLNGIIAQLF
jgi:hypothetical protein